MKSKLIGHNKPPRTHNYPKNRKPPRKKTPLDPDGELWRLPDTNILLNMNQRDLARTLNYSWRHFKKYQDRYKRWKKRQERFERTLEKHRQEYEEKKIQKILKRKERKVKIKARDITWISY